MKRVLFAAVLVVLTASVAASADWARDWGGIRDAAQQVKSIQARFGQKKEMKILARPLVSEGVFYYAAPDKIRLEYTSPVKSVLLMNAKRVERLFWQNGGFVKDTAMNADALQIVYQDIRNWLNGDFSANKSFEPALQPGPPAKIVLTPREQSIAQFLTRIEIGLAARPGVIDSIALIEGGAAVTRIEFKDVALNTNLAESLFHLEP